uniref:Uncharacterized protein n=1 Tax=Arundo donax TaxID=35708 RepID=A0A0A9H0I8_ARUDO
MENDPPEINFEMKVSSHHEPFIDLTNFISTDLSACKRKQLNPVDVEVFGEDGIQSP